MNAVLLLIAMLLLLLWIQAEINHRKTNKRLDSVFYRINAMDFDQATIRELVFEGNRHSLAWAEATNKLRADLLEVDISELEVDFVGSKAEVVDLLNRIQPSGHILDVDETYEENQRIVRGSN